MKIKNFLDYSLLKESLFLSLRGIKDADDFLNVPVLDTTNNNSISKSRTILFKNFSDSFELSYANKAGKVLNSIRVPKSVARIERGEDGKVCLITVNKYQNSEFPLDKLDDFIEDFGNYLAIKNGGRTEMAKCDIEIILDLLDLPEQVESIKKMGDNQWEATLGNGSLVDFKKRKPHDLMGSFRIYKTKDSTMPCIHLEDFGDSKKSSFNFDNTTSSIIEEPVGLSELRLRNPYHEFLINKCFGKETKSHEDKFVDYFIQKSKENSWLTPDSNRDPQFERMKKALSTFLPHREMESITFRNRN